MRARKDDGFTLVELLATMALMGIIAALAVGPFNGWRAAKEHQDAASQAVSAMRNAQVRAVAESVRYRVDFVDGGAALVVTRAPATTDPEQVVRRFEVADSQLSYTSPAFTTTSGPTTSAYFYPRGSASAGSLLVSRTGRDPIRIDVEGLTGRVTLDK